MSDKCQFKKYTVWVYFGEDGWSPMESTDSFDEASKEYIRFGGERDVAIMENIPVKLVPASVIKIEQPVYRG